MKITKSKKSPAIDSAHYDADCELPEIAHNDLKVREHESESRSSQWESDFSSSGDQDSSNSDYLP